MSRPADEPPDPWRLIAADWGIIWQSELAALGDDPETAQAAQAGAAAWLDAHSERGSRWSHRLGWAARPAASRPAGADAPARAAAADAAPDARDAAIERLQDRVAQLERRFARRESGADRG